MATTQPKINYYALVLLTIKEKRTFFMTGLVITAVFIFFVAYQLYRNGYFNQPYKKQIGRTQTLIKIDKNKQIYEIKEGDYLWKIAEEHYGSGFNAYDIARANKIIDPNNLIEGQKLILPDVSPKTPTKGETSSISTSQVTYKENTYTVQPGDFLWLIAVKVYGDGYAADRIINANNIPNINILEPGMVLKIPR